MRLPKSLAPLAALALAGCAMTATPPLPAPTGPDGLLAWPDLTARPQPRPSAEVRYGADAMQVVDLFLPDGPGPHPTVLMVHGGCWQTEIADRTLMRWVAEDLRKRGIAVWNIDYRGVDRDGGGYPGTFLDAAAAADALRAHAKRYDLDLSRLVATGHSAGGHLALWLAARPKLPQTSPLYSANPIPIHAVVSSGGLPDLEAAATPPGSGCGTEVIARLVGQGRGDPYTDTSVPRLGPIGVPQILVNGENDRIIPTAYAESYAGPMRTKGDDVRVRMVPRTGHVELVAPESAAWKATVDEIERALGR